MKKSAQVTLTVVAAVGLASCGRRRMDPCQPASFSQQACQEAIDGGGYYWQGSWFPMVYHSPYPYYYDSYRGYVSHGGRIYSAPTGAYSHSSASTPSSAKPSSASGSSSSSSPSSGVTRGGFGSTGAGHGAGE